jgi:hypothetical protein
MNKHHNLCPANREKHPLILKSDTCICWRLEAAEREAVAKLEHVIFGEGHALRVCCENHMRHLADQIVNGAVDSIVGELKEGE